MNKDPYIASDEIDLSQFFKAIWKEKIKIILIMLVTILVSYSYNQYTLKPDYFQISLNVKPSQKNISENFSFINKVLFNDDRNILKEDLQNQLKTVNNVNILERLIRDISYHEELLYVLKKNDTVKEKISRLSKEDQTKQLFEYTKLFSITKKPPNDYILNFNWHNVDEGRKILDDTLRLGLDNLQSTIFAEIEGKLKLEKKIIINEDLKKIEFLMEQSEIARALDIIEGQVDILRTDKNSIIVDYSDGAAYYLRGYKAIEMEINLIENRKYKDLTFVKEEIEILKNNFEVDWIYYNIFLTETKLLNKDSKLSLNISALLGIFIGLFYAFIVYLNKSKKVIRNKRAN